MSVSNTLEIPASLLKLPRKNSQPFKSIYIPSRIASLVVLLPFWAISSSVQKKPRESWTIGNLIAIRALRWIIPLNSECGMSPEAVSKTNPPKDFKESSLIWMDPVGQDLVVGVARDDKVGPVRVPGYVWPKGTRLEESDDGVTMLFIHGGGLMMGNGTERFGELDIVRKIMKANPKVSRVLSVEYRLVGDDCHPAQLLDVLTAYTHLVKTLKIDPTRIVVAGALTMMLSRYLNEEKLLPLPSGIMLFAPVLDMITDFEIVQGRAPERPNTSIDWLATSHYANLRFLGHNSPELFTYVSANRAPPGSYKGYPPIFISIGDVDMMLEETKQLVATLKTDGVDVTFDVQQDAVHEFLAMPFMPHESARMNAIQNASQWINTQLQARK